MSKASEWKEKCDKCNNVMNSRPRFVVRGGYGLAMVTNIGELDFYADQLNSKEAIAFAKWILDVFEDEKNEE